MNFYDLPSRQKRLKMIEGNPTVECPGSLRVSLPLMMLCSKWLYE
jgi:hypothetical protein